MTIDRHYGLPSSPPVGSAAWRYVRSCVARTSNWSGCGCNSPDKTGRDAGRVVGLGPDRGDDDRRLDDVVALQPDCVVYSAASAEMDAAAVRDYVRLLNGGLNVVTTNTPRNDVPRQVDSSIRRPGACRRPGREVTIYTSGIEPGFAGDQFARVVDNAVQHHPIDSARRRSSTIRRTRTST